MKLIRQARLFFQQGSSDKVYEVDLCEVGADQFVVNFRYGRRGKPLRDGTKTAAPVAQPVAQAIFDRLVESKTSKGYREHSGDSSSLAAAAHATTASATSELPQVDDPRAQAILSRLAAGHSSSSRWKLSRAVWRAGELRLREAEPLLIPLIGSGDPMLDYSLAAALSRCGSPASIERLQELRSNQALPYHVRRIAAEAILQVCPDDQRPALIEAYVQQLPESLRSLASNGPAEPFEQQLLRLLSGGQSETFAALDAIYFIDNQHVRPALLELLRTAPLQPSYFQQMRRIFKVAELRGDAEVFAILAARFEKEKSNFRMPSSWYYSYRTNEQKPTIGSNATHAFSAQTRNYLRGRVWRTLEQLGQLADSTYCEMATELLLAFDDQDAHPIRSHTTYRPPDFRATLQYVDKFGGYWAISNILYRNSPRYQRNSVKRYYGCRPVYNPTQPPARTETREEAFPELWDQVPEFLVRLLSESRCEIVHEFAVNALRANRSYCQQIELELLLSFLTAPYEATGAFAFDVAVERYDAANPDRRLVLAFANCGVERARSQAHRWIEVQRNLFFEDTEFACAMITSPFADTRTFARDSLRIVKPGIEQSRVIARRCIEHMLSLAEGQEEAASDIGVTLLAALADHLRTVDSETIRTLLEHPLAKVQLFGGELMLQHESLSKRPPPELLHAMISSEHAEVRGVGVRIVKQLPEQELAKSIDLLFALIRHPQADVRRDIRQTVKRLAESDHEFAGKLAMRLVDALQTPGADEGVPSHTAMILKEDLASFLSSVSPSTVWKLLQSRSGPAQDVGGMLLTTNVDANSLSVEELVKLASHDVLSVREACWAMCRDGIDRLRTAMASAVRLLDAKWEDSRQFGFELFRDHFKEAELSPAVLVSICDSVREEVQQFGCEMITRRFEQEDGQEYLLKLSEHPSVALQLFATNFLDRYATDNPDRLKELQPYFVSVLSRVNKARVAKDRVLALLAQEANKSEQAANIVSEIVARISGTNGVCDRSQTIQLMVDIQERYPQIGLPIHAEPVEVR